MPKYDPDKVELVKLSRPTRVREDGQKDVKLHPKGKVVKVSGNDKSQCLATGGTIVTGKAAENTPPAK
jgi:hypothetical protein